LERNRENSEKLLGELLIYNTPKALIISRNKIASRALDMYYNKYIEKQFNNIPLTLTKDGKVNYDIHKGSTKNVQEWFIKYLLFHKNGIGSIQEALAGYRVWNKNYENKVEPAVDLDLLLNEEFKGLLESNFTKQTVTDIINQLLFICNDTKQEIENAFNGNTKKDILVFYREPRRRIISGAIQDFFASFTNLSSREKLWFDLYIESSNKLDYSFIKNIFQDDPLPGDVIKKLKDTNSSTEREYFSTKIFSFIKPILKKWLKTRRTMESYDYTHTSPYLFLINDFLQKFDKNKVKLVNIDANRINGVGKNVNLDTLLLPVYEFESSDFHVDSGSMLGKHLDENSSESNERWFEVLGPLITADTRFQVIINSELFYYGKMVNDESNLYKINK